MEINKIKNIIPANHIKPEPLGNICAEFQLLPLDTKQVSFGRVGQRRLRTKTLNQPNIVNLKTSSPSRIKPKPEEVVAVLQKYTPPNQAIFIAAGGGDLESVKILLDYGVEYTTEVNVKDGIIRWHLVDGKIKWNVTDSACRSGNLALIKYLVEERKILPANNPFITLIKKHSPSFDGIDFFLSKGYKFPPGIIFDAFYQTQAISTLDLKIDMHHSTEPVSLPNIETIKFLISRGATLPKVKGSFSENLGPIYIWHAIFQNLYGNSDSAKNKAREMATLLLENGLNPDVSCLYIPYTPFNSNKKGIGINFFHNFTLPLAVAIQHEDIELIRMLLDAGVDPNQKAGYYIWEKIPNQSRLQKNRWHWTPSNIKFTPIELATTKKNSEILQLLLEHGAKI